MKCPKCETSDLIDATVTIYCPNAGCGYYVGKPPITVPTHDCPCFGDTVEHSIDCANCTCDKSCKAQVAKP